MQHTPPSVIISPNGELFDMSDAPFSQKAVPAEAAGDDAKAARVHLQAVLDKLSPGTGKTDAAALKKGEGGKGKENAKAETK